jgi:alkanesulfonate monooxygenase SsuD/methylene tetrahydromethanopterin reductase-like flavin-dependent oxidoreductase (luciferase family)
MLRRMPGRPRIGIQLPEAERKVPIGEYLAMARAAEEVGFDSIWVGDHLLYRDEGPERGPLEAFTLLAAISTATTGIRLGPLVACTAFRHPPVLAKMAATVDEISGGRLTLGLGAGWNRTEFEAFGLPFDGRAARSIEAFQIVRGLLAGERVTFEGDGYGADDAVLLPPMAHRIPLMIGSMGERVLEATLPSVDMWNVWGPWCGNDPAGFEEQDERVTRIARRLGRDPETVARSICVFTAIDLIPGEEPVDEDAPPLTGSMVDIAGGLRAFAEAGADEVILIPSPNTERAIRAFGEALSLLSQ